MNSKTKTSYTIESKDKNIIKSFTVSFCPDDTVEKVRFEITKRLGCSFDDFDIVIAVDDETFGTLNPKKKQIIVNFKEDRIISDDEYMKAIIIVGLPLVEEKALKDKLYEIFNQYGKIERMILKQNTDNSNDNDNESYDCIVVYDNELSVEKSRLYQHPILNKEVVIMKASSVLTSGDAKNKKKGGGDGNDDDDESRSVNVMYEGIKAFSTIQKYDGKHYNLIQKFGGALESVGDMSMKIANKVDSSLNLSDKLKPILDTTPVKIMSTAFSKIGDVTMNTYERASNKFEKEEKLKEEMKRMKEKEEKKKDDRKVNEMKEETKDAVKEEEKRDVEKVDNTQETKKEMKSSHEEEEEKKYD